MKRELSAVCDIEITWGRYGYIKKSLEIPGERVTERDDGFMCNWENVLGNNNFILNWKADRLVLNYAGVYYNLSLTDDNVRVILSAYSMGSTIDYMDQYGKSALHDFLEGLQK